MTKSVTGRYWRSKDVNEELVQKIVQGLQVSDFLARLISVRISCYQEAEDFLVPKLKNLMPDPMHLLDMEKAVIRMIQAISERERICIFADYDVDGATSSALLKNVLREIGIDSYIYVPDRLTEGYGPNKLAFDTIKNRDTKLIITVDCGSTSYEPLAYAAQLGMDVIVIDHHMTTEVMPEAVAVINPNRLDETSQCTNLAAVGVTFLFVIALVTELKKQDFFAKNNINPPDLIKHLDVVALGTVCDVMKLTGLNRAFVAQGLKVAHKRGNLGYRSLCDIASVDEKLNCYHLGFILGPRINAGGRVGKASLGAQLLSTTSISEAVTFAQELDSYNIERKNIELEMLKIAIEMAEEQKLKNHLFVVGDGWHPGVIGIIAGRLKELYNKPVVVLAVDDGIGKASCRSISGIDLGSKIIMAKEIGLLISGGGHAMAAGFTVAEDKIDELYEFLEGLFAKDLANSSEHLYQYYDADLVPSSLNLDLLKEIDKLEPYGNGNPAPVFRFSDVFVLKASIVGGNHIKLLLAPTGYAMKGCGLNAMAFNSLSSPLYDTLMSTKPLNLTVFGQLKVNKWQGNESVQLIVKDVIVQS